jgi:hypothetical protein
MGGFDRDRIEAAIARAHAVMARTQGADGAWRSFCDQGPAATAQVVVGLRYVGRLDATDAADAARWLERHQRSDGSFVAHPFAASGDLGATACAWAALVAAGRAEDADSVRRARAFVESHGGASALVARVNEGDLSALFVGMAGLVPAKELPEPAHLFALVPPIERWVERRFNVQMPFLLALTALLVQALRGERGLTSLLEDRACLALLDRFQNADGSWMFGDTMHAILALATLHAMGRGEDDPRFARGLAWLAGQKRRDADGLWYSLFQGDVWTTAFALRALRASGVSPADDAMKRATTWLVKQQIDGREWAFQQGNTRMPDCDDAGVVLGALGVTLDGAAGAELASDVAASARAAVDGATEWLAQMQNADGGWASFQHGLPGKSPAR